MIPIYNSREAIGLPQIDTLGCQKKGMEHKGGQRAVISNSEKNQPRSLSRYRVTLSEGIRQVGRQLVSQ